MSCEVCPGPEGREVSKVVGARNMSECGGKTLLNKPHRLSCSIQIQQTQKSYCHNIFKMKAFISVIKAQI